MLKSYLIYHKTVLLLYFDKLMSSFYNFIDNKNYSTISNYFNYPSKKLVTVARWTHPNLYQAPVRKIYLLNLWITYNGHLIWSRLFIRLLLNCEGSLSSPDLDSSSGKWFANILGMSYILISWLCFNKCPKKLMPPNLTVIALLLLWLMCHV